MNYILAPSILSADFANLQRDIEMINQSEADWFHVDIMDGVFVPNISFGFPVMTAAKKYAKKPFDVHLMIVNPEKYIEEVAKAGADIITVHYEACPHLHRVIQLIKAQGCMAGVAINPHTPISLLTDILIDIDMVLVMSVNPGFGGQQFILQTFNKVTELRKLANTIKIELIIEVDGGVNIGNAPALLQAGANVLVVGNAIFSAENPLEMIKDLKSINVNSQVI